MRVIIQQIMDIPTNIVQFIKIHKQYQMNIIIQKVVFKKHQKIRLSFKIIQISWRFCWRLLSQYKERGNRLFKRAWNCLFRLEQLIKRRRRSKTKEDLFQNVVDTVGEKKNVVILMHDAADKILTYETLPDVIQYLRDNGYQFKTIYDILQEEKMLYDVIIIGSGPAGISASLYTKGQAQKLLLFQKELER